MNLEIVMQSQIMHRKKQINVCSHLQVEIKNTKPDTQK